MVDSSATSSYNNGTFQNHVEPQRHYTISGPITSGQSNGSANVVTTVPSSPSKSSSSANSSPKMGKRSLSTSTSSPRPRRHAPPPPSGTAANVAGTSVSRRNKVKALKDNRYSLQVDPRDLHDHHHHHNQSNFGSLPRRSGPIPPIRHESIQEPSVGTLNGTSSSKPPLHPSVSLGSGASLQEARLAGYSSFVSPQQTGGSSSLQPALAQTRRYSSDATSGTAQLATPPEMRRLSAGEMAAASNYSSSSPQLQKSQQQQQQSSEMRYQHAHSTSSTGSHGSVNNTTNSPRSHSNRSSASPGSPRKDRSRSGSKERDFFHDQAVGPPPVVKLDLPTSFSSSDGMELVEAVRKKTGVSHRKSIIAINEVLEFLKGRVPMCGEMVDGLLSAVQETQQVYKAIKV